MSDPLRAPRVIDRPEPGFWLARMRRGAPLIPVAIVRRAVPHEPDNPENVMGEETRSPTLVGLIGDRECDPLRIWTMSPEREVSEAEWRFRAADLAWLQQYQPDDPAAKPFERVDHMTTRF